MRICPPSGNVTTSTPPRPWVTASGAPPTPPRPAGHTCAPKVRGHGVVGGRRRRSSRRGGLQGCGRNCAAYSALAAGSNASSSVRNAVGMLQQVHLHAADVDRRRRPAPAAPRPPRIASSLVRVERADALRGDGPGPGRPHPGARIRPPALDHADRRQQPRGGAARLLRRRDRRLRTPAAPRPTPTTPMQAGQRDHDRSHAATYAQRCRARRNLPPPTRRATLGHDLLDPRARSRDRGVRRRRRLPLLRRRRAVHPCRRAGWRPVHPGAGQPDVRAGRHGAAARRALPPQAVVDRAGRPRPGPAASGSCTSSTRPGGVAQHTGPDCVSWAGQRRGRHVSVAGNMLAGPAVLDAMLDGFAAAAGPLALRLIAALQAGEDAGGDKRGRQSAARARPYSTTRYPDLDIRADDHPDPLAELRRLHRVSLERFAVFRRMMAGRAQPAGACWTAPRSRPPSPATASRSMAEQLTCGRSLALAALFALLALAGPAAGAIHADDRAARGSGRARSHARLRLCRAGSSMPPCATS